MSKKILILGICSILIVNGAWIWKYHQIVQELSSRVGDSRYRMEQLINGFSLMAKTWRTGIESNAKSLNGNLALWSMDGRTFQLSHLLSQDEKLILFLSDSNCSSCVEKLLFLLNSEKYCDLADHLLVLYIAEDETKRIWCQRQQILKRAKFFRFLDPGEKLPWDSNNPVFVLSGPDLVAEHYYTVYPALDSQTEDYLAVIADRYF
jgi:hypothetical protein